MKVGGAGLVVDLEIEIGLARDGRGGRDGTYSDLFAFVLDCGDLSVDELDDFHYDRLKYALDLFPVVAKTPRYPLLGNSFVWPNSTHLVTLINPQSIPSTSSSGNPGNWIGNTS